MIAHISDLHVGGSTTPDQLRRLWGSLRHNLTNGDLLIITGDLTESGEAGEWSQLIAPLQGLRDQGVRVLAVPGNHDCAWRGIGRYEASRVQGLDALPLAWDTRALWPRFYAQGSARVAGLNSSLGLERQLHPPLARGQIGRKQMSRLQAQGSGLIDVIALHHHPHRHDAMHLLEDVEDFRLVVERSKASLVLFGHRHRPYRAWHGDVLYSGAPSTPEVSWYTVWEGLASRQIRF